jgi:nicotinate phosphoribosyltransferase
MNTHTPLLTDLYQLTMAAGYWKCGKAEQEAVFHLFFRKLPFAGGYALAAGLGDVVEWLQGFRFGREELDYLATLPGRDGRPLFESGFLAYLGKMKWRCDVDAIPEGTVVFPHEPLIRVRGPLVQAQLVETALLNIVNFQTLIATKAARVCEAARGEPVLEFGLRRAQGPDGAVMASRAAFIGGAAATSNVLAGMIHGIPVRGTHAHSWVMSFDSEPEAFEAYAAALPNNCVFLVDTYDTLEGVKNAIEVGKQLRDRGHELAGVRLDSGDLAWLSIEARRILDEGGFPNASIVASNDLDENLIESLKHQGAKISVWGVGTQMVTGGSQPALGGVYKLGAIRHAAGEWEPRIKLSEQAAKVSNPGIQQVRRFTLNGEFCGDAIFDEASGLAQPVTIVHPSDATRIKIMPEEATSEDLLQPVFRGGELVMALPALPEIRQRGSGQLARLHASVKRLQHPHDYPAGVERLLQARKLELIRQARRTPGRIPS